MVHTPKTFKVFAPLLIGAMLSGCGMGAKPVPKPGGVNHSALPIPSAAPKRVWPRLKVMAFYDQYTAAIPPNPLKMLDSHRGLVDYLAPFWYEVEPGGTIKTKPQLPKNLSALAAKQNIKMVPLFNNAKGTDVFLHSAASRKAAVAHIVAIVKSKHYAGVNIDFQMLKATDRNALTAFMKDLHAAMPHGALLSMSVVPLTSQNGQSSAYNYRVLDKYVGAMILMAYDKHGDGTPPGPVSPYPWVQKSIQTAIKAGIVPKKLYLGIANYGYEWTGGSTKAKTIPLKVMYQHKYGTFKWDNTQKEAVDRWTSGGTSHIIWFVNDQGAADRIRLAERDHLGGVAFWRIGYEDARWWNTVAKAIMSSGYTGGTPIAPKGSAKPSLPIPIPQGPSLKPSHSP